MALLPLRIIHPRQPPRVVRRMIRLTAIRLGLSVFFLLYSCTRGFSARDRDGALCAIAVCPRE
ncbi:hypothetical protein, partial [Afifella sp. IM 167]|uniref:hypothetical protein n=1 Tax=Afifella sp. IM 167 TaxID=2033586 RepID=UPI001CCFBC92